MKNLYVRLSANVGEFRQQMHAAGAATKQFGTEMTAAAATSRQSFDRLGKAGMIAGGLVVAGLAAATVSAARFEQAMRNTNSIMKQSEAELRATSAAVLDMSRRVPQSAQNLAEGLYDIASSSFQGAEGLEVLEASAIAATAGMSTTATAARAITGVLNAYGMASSDAAHVSDVLFQTVNVGVLTFEELAQNVGDFVSTAAALNVSVEETGAALATMTLAGINAAEASTALNRVMSSFIKPSDAMKAAIQSLGYESGTAMVDALGLKGAVEAIDQASQGSVSSIANMYGEVRAIKGALALAAAEGKNYDETTRAMGDASDGAGAAMEAYNEQSKAFTTQLKQAQNSVGAVAIEMGTTFLPVLTSGAKVVGSVAEAVGALPGPLKSAVAVSALLAGGIALVGGAALVAVPKVVAYNEAVALMGASSPMAARGLGLLGTAAGALGKIGLVGAAISAVAVGLDYLGEKAQDVMYDAAPAVQLLVSALEEMAAKGKPAGEVARAFGANLNALSAAITEAAGDDGTFGQLAAGFQGGGVLDQMIGFATGANPAIESAEDNIAALNDAFATAFQTDPTGAIESWNALVTEWEAGGRNVGELIVALPAVSEGLANNTAASEAAKAEMEALKEEARGLGIELDDTSDLLNMSAEDMEKLRGSTDPVIFSMLELGRVTKAQAEAMQSDLTSFVDDVASAFGEVTGPLNIYVATVEQVNEDAKLAWDKAGKSSEDFTERASLSMGEWVTAMQSTAERTRQFSADVNRAIEAGYDPSLIAQLLQMGPEEAAPILQTMLSDHSGRMVGIVNDSVAALNAVNEQAVQMARLVHLATTAETDTMVADLDDAMAIAQQKAALGAGATAAAIASALDMKLADVRRIIGEYGIELAKLGTVTRAPARNPDAGGARVRAHGGIDGPHVAQIAPATMRVWAEPETGGEAYIPLASSKRGRSLSIWRETGHRLGVRGFADGGFLSPVQQWGQAMEQNAREARDVQRGITDVAFDLGGVQLRDYLAELDARMAAEQKFTTEWKQHHDRRKQVLEDFARGLDAVYDKIATEQDNMLAEERLTSDEYVAILHDRHTRAAQLTGYWGAEATRIRQQIRDAEAAEMAEAREAEDVMYAEGRMSGDDYVRALKERHAEVAEQYGYWSEAAHQVRDQIRGVWDDMAADAKEAADTAAAAIEEAVTKYAGVYERARDRFRSQQVEYDRMVSAARTAVTGELTNVYAAAQRRFTDQADALDQVLADRNAAMTERVNDFRDSIAEPMRDVGDLLSVFGSDMDVNSDEIVAMLDHRVEAARRWNDTLRDLQAGGLDKALVTQLAQAGPEALGLATALQSVDPTVVNDAMAQLAAMGASLADVFVTQEEAGIAAQVAAELPLPAMQSFNDLLNEEMAAWLELRAERGAAQSWAEGMATSYMPAVNYEWRTFADLLKEEIASQQQADKDRKQAEAWARRMVKDVMPALSDQYAWNTALLDNMNKQLAAIPREITTVHTIITRNVTEGGATGKRASGGSTTPGGTYLVGEDGPELLTMGGTPGYVHQARTFPMGSALGGGIVVHPGAVQIAVDASGQDADAIGAAVERGASEALRKVLEADSQGVR